MKPKVSVIIPTYNRSDLLRNAVKSVQSQTLENWEAIVVDDGSTDDTKAVTAELIKSDPRIKYLYEENAGQGAARNKGLEVATGEYIAFLDSDDVYLNHNLEKKIAILDSRKELLIVNGRSWVVEYETGRFTDCASYPPTNWVVRKEFFSAGGKFKPWQRNVEDMAIRIRAHNARDASEIEYILPEPLSIYFLHGSQVTKTPNQHPDVFAKRLETLLEDLDPSKPNSYREFAPLIFSRLANFYILEGEYAKGRELFRKSLSVRFNTFALIMFMASYAGIGPYKVFENALRSIQKNLLWRLRLNRAAKVYRDSFNSALATLRLLAR